jgi:Fe2+ or Zn2+ uptake regulation protein
MAAGVVHRIVAADEHGHYELAEDLTSHHHHLVCTHCGRVTDFDAGTRLEETLDAALGRIARRNGFRIDGHRLDVLGACADCR